MSEKLDRRERDFSKFDSMTTEQLQHILRLDAMKPIGKESDTEELFYIMEVLADRRRNDSAYTGRKTAQQAFEDFQKYYMPEESDDNDADIMPVKQNRHSVLWFRRIAAVAAALAIVALTTVTADAFGYNLFGKVAKWSEEFFHFNDMTYATSPPVPEKTDPLHYSSLQELLALNGITLNLAPGWLPDGFLLAEMDIVTSPKENVFYANYRRNEDEVIISIRQLLSSFPMEIEKNDDCVEVYEHNGVAHYLFSNLDRIRAVWVIDEFECFITGNITIEEMKEIIDSI